MTERRHHSTVLGAYYSRVEQARKRDEARATQRSRRVQEGAKRLLDISVSAVALTVLSPMLGVVTLVSRCVLGGPVLFRQTRPGRDGEAFEVLKFRSMSDERDVDGRLLPDKDRLGPWGRFLRRSSLDELPQLWSVLTGRMSLVGPRPLRVEYLAHYSPTQRRRHEVRPGITGLAQVSGRNDLSWEEKFELDVYYVDHLSLGLDLRILWRTVRKLLSGQGVNPSSGLPLRPFTGTQEEAG